MRVVIDIPEEVYADACEYAYFDKNSNWEEVLSRAIRCGTPLPKEHGRLIDADKLKGQYRCGAGNTDDENAWITTIRRSITNAPTIIGADKEE